MARKPSQTQSRMVEILRSVRHDGDRHKPGDVVEMPGDAADELAAIGAVRVRPAEPKPDPAGN